MFRVLKAIIIVSIVLMPALLSADDQQGSKGFLFGLFGADGEKHSDNQNDSAVAGAPLGIRLSSRLPQGLLLNDGHAALEGGWLVEYEGGLHNEEQMAHVLIQKSVGHECWGGEGGCWQEYRRAADGNWQMKLAGLQFPAEGSGQWNATGAEVNVDGDVLHITHGYDVFRRSNYRGHEQVALDSLASGRMVGRWSHHAPYAEALSGVSTWTKVAPTVDRIAIYSRDKSGAWQGQFSQQGGLVAESGQPLAAVIPYSASWWRPDGFHARAYAPTFLIDLYGENLWAHTYAWIARNTGLEIQASYICDDGSAWRWWGGFGYCLTHNSRMKGLRFTLNTWPEAVPGFKELVVDGTAIPFELQIDGYPVEATLRAALEFRTTDNSRLDQVVIGQPFYVVALVENAVGNSIVPVTLSVDAGNGPALSLSLQPTNTEGLYRSERPLMFERRPSAVLSATDGAPLPAVVPAEMAGAYRLILSRFADEKDLVADINLDGSRRRLTLDATVGGEPVLVDALISRAKYYGAGTGPFRAALEIRLNSIISRVGGAAALPDASLDMLARRDVQVIPVQADAGSATVRVADSSAALTYSAAPDGVDAADPLITTVNLFSRSSLENFDGGWETRTGARDYVFNEAAAMTALTALCADEASADCVDRPAAAADDEAVVIRVRQSESVQSGGGYIVFDEPFFVEVELPTGEAYREGRANPEALVIAFLAGDPLVKGGATEQTLRLPLVAGRGNLYRNATPIDPRKGGGTNWTDLSLDVGGFDTKGREEPLRIQYGEAVADFLFVRSYTHAIALRALSRWRAAVRAIEALIDRRGLSVAEWRELGDENTPADRRTFLAQIRLHPEGARDLQGRIVFLNAAIARVEGLLQHANRVESESLFRTADDKRALAAAWAKAIYYATDGDYREYAGSTERAEARLRILGGYEVPANRRALAQAKGPRLAREASVVTFRHALDVARMQDPLPAVEKVIKIFGIDVTKPVAADGTWAVVPADEYIQNLGDLGLELVGDRVFQMTNMRVAEELGGYASGSLPLPRLQRVRPDGEPRRPDGPGPDRRNGSIQSGGTGASATAGNSGSSAAPGAGDRTLARLSPVDDSGTLKVDRPLGDAADATATAFGRPFAEPNGFSPRQVDIYTRLTTMGVPHGNAALQARLQGSRPYMDNDTALAGAAVLLDVDADLLARELGLSSREARDHVARFLEQTGLAESAAEAAGMADTYMNRVQPAGGDYRAAQVVGDDGPTRSADFARPPASGAPPTPPPSHAGSAADPDGPLPPLEIDWRQAPEGHMTVAVYNPAHPATKVRFELVEGVIDITDINSAALGPGMGPVLMARALAMADVDLRQNFRFSAINNPPTLVAYAGGVSAAESVLGRTGLRAAEILGIPVRDVRYEPYYHGSKLRIVFEVGQ